MKFLSFYEDLLLEERPLSDANLDKIIPKLPQYIFDELSLNPRAILSLPQINFFKSKLSELYGDDYDLNDPDILLLGLEEHMDSILERGMNAVQQTRFIKQIQGQYPRIDEKIKREGRSKSSYPTYNRFISELNDEKIYVWNFIECHFGLILLWRIGFRCW